MVLVLGGNDPSGGAGLAADVQAIARLGAHPAPVVTAVTVQDSGGVQGFRPLAPEEVLAQARAVFADLPVAAVKTGMLATPACAAACALLLDEHPGLPLVVDPVLAAGGGGALAESGLADALRSLLVPRARLLTPNREELRRLAPEGNGLGPRARALLGAGAGAVYVTGADGTGGEGITHHLFTAEGETLEITCERLPGRYHGSGCTLAAAAAALLARGRGLPAAVREAQDYTWQSLRHGFRAGRAQAFPDRLWDCRRGPRGHD